MHAKRIKTKNTSKWIIFPILFLVGICSYLLINARNLIFPDISDSNDNLKGRFSGIHFTSLGNDFGGGVFWEVGDINSEITQIQLGDNVDNVKCGKQQARGLYYNDARGARLWPLDKKTLATLQKSNDSYKDLSMTGGLYRACDKNKEMVIYGAIEYTLSGSTTPSWLIAGVKLDNNTNSYTGEFAENLQFFNNKTPIGYIWDSYGGIGFIGGKLDGTGCVALLNYLNTGSVQEAFYLDQDAKVQLNNSFAPSCNRIAENGSATDMRNLLIQGNTILSTAVSSWEKTALLGALQEKTVLLSSSDINSATVMNAAKKNAGALCRGKPILDSSDEHSINTDLVSNDVLCYQNAPNLRLDVSNWNYKGKTIIINSGNVSLFGSMSGDAPAIDLFLDRGNVYLTDLSAGGFTDLNIQGFPSATDTKNRGRFLKGNFVINGLLLGGTPGDIKSITNKLHIYGKFVSLNTPLTLSNGRKEQVKDILGTETYSDRIPFKKTLGWECLYEGLGSDNTPCGGSGTITSIPFVVLDGNFTSKLIK